MEISQNVIDMRDGLTKTLGITYLSTPEPDSIEARMVCTEKCSQPWGYLSGGATLALAENVAGVASMCLVPGKVVLGINVTANHVSSIRLGESVIAKAILIRKGGRLHNWRIEVRSEQTGAVVSEILVTNYIRDLKNGE